jgi:hypothetical protein
LLCRYFARQCPTTSSIIEAHRTKSKTPTHSPYIFAYLILISLLASLVFHQISAIFSDLSPQCLMPFLFRLVTLRDIWSALPHIVSSFHTIAFVCYALICSTAKNVRLCYKRRMKGYDMFYALCVPNTQWMDSTHGSSLIGGARSADLHGQSFRASIQN